MYTWHASSGGPFVVNTAQLPAIRHQNFRAGCGHFELRVPEMTRKTLTAERLLASQERPHSLVCVIQAKR
jgi:hypothetical protein